uniref:CARD domain-containing protein n=1 Tax=Sparus aurata TaxID=8175 RepID=A0A671XCU1_SPAAU
MEEPVTAVSSSVTNTQPTRPHLQLSSHPGWSQRGSSCLPRCHSVPSLSQILSAENKTFRPSQSLSDIPLKTSFEEFTPVTVDDNDESYRFLCSCPGLYQCSVTGLVFHMEGEGDVVYRIVSWDRRLLAQHHKKPAGPLSFIEGISGPVLKSLLDKLFEKKVLTDSERESADDKHNREDKARFVIDTVRRKGEAASLEVIEFLREVDPFLCKHLGLIVT